MRVKYFLFFAVLFMFSGEQVRAGISSGWIDYFVGKIGKPGSSAFEVMSENGLILSRLKNDYAAFSFGETRLSDNEKLSEPVDVSEFDFVVEFEVCGEQQNFFNNTIYKVNYRYHNDVASTMIDEILDINEFFNRMRGDVSPNIVESTNEKLVTTYLLGIGPIKNVTFQTTISKSKHYIQISAVAETLCAVSS